MAFLGFSLRSQDSLRRLNLDFSRTPQSWGNIAQTHDCTAVNSHGRRQISRVSPGFKLECTSRTLASPTTVRIDGGKKRYGGVLPSILRSLESEDDIEGTLKLCCGKLGPKEQTVILREQGSWERVVRVFEWMKSQKDYLPNVIHYNVVLRVLGMAQKWDELRLCWVEMERNGVLPTNNTYGMLVDVYGKAGLVKESMLWIKHMRSRGIFPDEVTMNTALRVLKDAGEFNRAEIFYKHWCAGRVDLDGLAFDSMPDSASGSSSDRISFKQFLSTELFKTGGRVPPSKVVRDFKVSVQKPQRTATYNTLIDLYGKAGRLKDAAETFAEMLKNGVAMDAFTFNTMIFICGSHGNLSEAEALLNKMEERGIPPDTKTYNIFLSLYADVGNIDAALKCYRKIREAGLFPDVVTYRALLHILCKNNMVSQMEVVIEEMEKSGVHVNEHSLPVVIKMYINEGFFEKAKTFLEKHQSNCRVSSKTYGAIIDAYAEKGFWNEAEAVFFRKRDISGSNRDVVEYNVMIKAYGKANLCHKALSLFKSMKNQGTWPNECTYNSIIQMFSGGDEVDQARDLLVSMEGAGYKPACQTFSAIIASYVRLGQLSDAVDVYEQMMKVGVHPNEVVFGSLIDGFSEAGKVEEALQYFQMMKELRILPNQIVLTSLLKAYSKMGFLDGAKQLYETMKGLEGGPDIVASNSMINLYAGFGMVTEARCIFDDLREKGLADGVSFGIMMHLYKSMGMLSEAIDVASKMRQSGLLNDCTAFNQVMACYATNGEVHECCDLLHEMVNVQKILPNDGTFKLLFTILKNGRIQMETLSQLESSLQERKPYARQIVMVYVLAMVGLHPSALKWCEAFAKFEASLDAYAYNAAIYAYGTAGKIDEALNIFMKMQDQGVEPDIVTFINLVICYGKAGMLSGVKRIHTQIKSGEIELNESLFEAIMVAYGNANRRDLAEMVRQDMLFAFDTQKIESETEDELNDGTSETCMDL